MFKRRLMVTVAIIMMMVSAIAPSRVLAADGVFKGCNDSHDNPSINTALGCVPAKWDTFAPWMLTALFGIAGGIAFLLMAYGFISLATSKGDPKAVAAAQSTITSAITGLLISIFALFILRLVAVKILQIPGLS